MGSRAVIQAFDQYEKARIHFAQTMADMALRSINVDCMLKCNVLELLQALLSDPSLRVQQNAALAIGRLSNNSPEAAKAAVNVDVLPTMLKGIEKRSKYYKKAAMFSLRCVAKHSAEMATTLVASGALEAILTCLEEFDTGVKEAAAWAVGYITKHNTALAQACVTAGVLPMLQLCLHEPELCLKQVAASTIGDIAKHDPSLSQAICDSGCTMLLAKCMAFPSPRLKKQAICALSQIAKHTLNLAESVVETDVVTDAVLHLGHPDTTVRKAAANLLCEICKHHVQLAQLVVNSGGIGGLLQLIQSGDEEPMFPAVLAIGFMAAQSEFIALAIKASRGIETLAFMLNQNFPDHILATLAWAIGQIGKHTSEHSETVAKANTFQRLLELYQSPKSSENLKQKCKGALKLTLSMCTSLTELEPMLEKAPPEILKYVLAQYSQLLPVDARARRLFVESGCLQRIQKIQAEPGSTLMELINIVNHCFPEEIIRYYSPGYPESFIEAVENYKPTVPAMFTREHDDPEDSEIMDALRPPAKNEFEIC
ncbi:sperm-associated antigen 6-like [Cimex lectularius]|uniref:Sperm-associated antigen 6 n=1 Tax=Cimex lectularius TaxID=79782 RepID=A0A8I6TBR2_CIMLE|nr:sperm-associated antigen 6-like [Cimex lectularius]